MLGTAQDEDGQLVRAALTNGLRLIATKLAPGVYLVRFHPDAGPHYDRMIVVTEKDDGRELHLSGWIGNPLSIDWRAVRDALFPRGRCIRWERLQKDGTLKPHELKLPPSPKAEASWADQ